MDLLAPRHERLVPNFYAFGYGSDSEPVSTRWMASLIAPLGERFREGVRLLDYGCGAGRLFNFMTGHLRGFHYFGAEPAWSKALDTARAHFGHDSRASFLTCEELPSSAVAMSCDVAVLGSVLTHIAPEACDEILCRLSPIIGRGGAVVFSAFIAPETELREPGVYGREDCYGVARQSERWLASLPERHGCAVVECEPFDFHPTLRHRIFRMERDG